VSPSVTRRRRKQTPAFIILGAVVAAGVIGWAVWPRNTGQADAEAEYNKSTGRLEKLVTDLNKNGVMDTVSYMDGTRFVRNELDHDENGKTERWDFFLPDGKTIEKVGLATRNDGVMDSIAYYDAEGKTRRIEISTARNGTFNKVETYQAGVLVSSAEDTNGNGKPDKWDTYAPFPSADPKVPSYTITSSAFDDSGSGHPERRLVYGLGGKILRIELDPDGDGVFVLLNSKPVKDQ
jgi:hypothetical protein